MSRVSNYGCNIVVHGLSNGRSGIGIFVSRLSPLPMIAGVGVIGVIPAAVTMAEPFLVPPVTRPYGKNYRKSFLGRSK